MQREGSYAYSKVEPQRSGRIEHETPTYVSKMVASQGLHGDVMLAYTLKGDGPTTVLIHGWACNRGFWKHQIPALSRFYLVLALDLRGHGDSEVPEQGYTLSHLAEDVHVSISNLGLGPVAVVGHSMGGMVAQEIALRYPEDLSSLVLVATTAADPEDTLISKRIAAEASELGYRAAFLREFPRWFSDSASHEWVEWAKEQMLHTPERVALDLVRAYGPVDFRGRLGEVRVPTLVIGAAGDVSTTTFRSREIATLIPSPRLLVLESSGHFVQLERPTETNAAIQRFLSETGL